MAEDRIDIHTQARGSHWVAWVTRPGETAPLVPIQMVGATQEEAEARMRAWWESRQR
jgi:hypothetical protein